jgi:hypothetical protein
MATRLFAIASAVRIGVCMAKSVTGMRDAVNRHLCPADVNALSSRKHRWLRPRFGYFRCAFRDMRPRLQGNSACSRRARIFDSESAAFVRLTADDALPSSASMRHSTATTRLATIVGIWVRPNVSSSHRPLLLREHQVQVLNRSAGCAFAKIIENCGQQDVPVFHVRKYA